MPLSFLSTIHEHTYQNGVSTLLGLSRENRYHAFRASDLQNLNLYKRISSAVVYPTSNADATVIFFGFPLSFFNVRDYNGYFVQITNRKNSGSNREVDRFSNYSFNDSTQSMLLVGPNRSGFEVRLSFRDLFLNKWNTLLDAALRNSQARRNGNPTLTWEMWPQGISHLNSNRKYLKIHQKVRIELSWWPDYDATITYHIYLYLNSRGNLRGYVARWAYWVEGGIKSSAIANELEPKVISGMNDLNNQLNDQLSDYESFSFQDLYYLSGNQTSRAPNGVLTGWTTNDTTIVLVI